MNLVIKIVSVAFAVSLFTCSFGQAFAENYIASKNVAWFSIHLGNPIHNKSTLGKLICKYKAFKLLCEKPCSTKNNKHCKK